MTVSLLAPFFNLTVPVVSSKLIYGVSHFFNRVRVLAKWNTYDVVIPAQGGKGRLILGQIPISTFSEAITGELGDNGLVVSCNEAFELAGVGTPYAVIPPYRWAHYGIEHHHLPFTDFSDNAEPLLVIQALERMMITFNEGGTIYLHCKAGRSRSGLVAALFACVSDDTIKHRLMACSDDAQIMQILTEVIQELTKIRPQVSIGTAKLNLAITVLKNYINHWKEASADHAYFQMADPKQPVTAAQDLLDYSQSPDYKFVCDQGYKNIANFPAIKSFANHFYLNAKDRDQEGTRQFCPQRAIKAVFAKMDKADRSIVEDLYNLYLANKEFLNTLLEMSESHPEINKLGIELCHKILDSDATNRQKEDWLKETTQCLKNPTPEQIKKYCDLAENILSSGNQGLRTIGTAMIVLGIAFITVALIAATIATGGVFGEALVVLAGISLGGLGAGVGKILYELGKPDGVAQQSIALMNQVGSHSIVEHKPTSDVPTFLPH